MKLTKKDLRTIRKILKQHDVKHAELFGSYARGEANKRSDVDVLVDLPKKMSLFGLVRLERILKENTGFTFDLVTYRSIHPRLKTFIEKDKVKIL